MSSVGAARRSGSAGEAVPSHGTRPAQCFRASGSLARVRREIGRRRLSAALCPPPRRCRAMYSIENQYGDCQLSLRRHEGSPCKVASPPLPPLPQMALEWC